jgi:hypothetical protein
MTQPPVDFSPLAGREIPGGCDECDAYQTVRQVTDGIWSLTVHHDENCRFDRARVGKSGAN